MIVDEVIKLKNKNQYKVDCYCLIYDFIFLSDMTFTHEGNKTFVDSLVNFEKMVSFMYLFFG